MCAYLRYAPTMARFVTYTCLLAILLCILFVRALCSVAWHITYLFVCFWFWLVFFSESVRKVLNGCLCYRKDVLDQCLRDANEILQVLMFKTQTKAASRARTGYGSNQ